MSDDVNSDLINIMTLETLTESDVLVFNAQVDAYKIFFRIRLAEKIIDIPFGCIGIPHYENLQNEPCELDHFKNDELLKIFSLQSSRDVVSMELRVVNGQLEVAMRCSKNGYANKAA